MKRSVYTAWRRRLRLNSAGGVTNVPIVLLGARQNLSERHACLVGAGEICDKQVARFWRGNPVWFWLALKLLVYLDRWVG